MPGDKTVINVLKCRKLNLFTEITLFRFGFLRLLMTVDKRDFCTFFLKNRVENSKPKKYTIPLFDIKLFIKSALLC